MGLFPKLVCILAAASFGAAQDIIDPSGQVPLPSVEVPVSTDLPTASPTVEPTTATSSEPSNTSSEPTESATSAPSIVTSIAPAVTPSAAPGPPSSNLTSISFSGNGCPQGTQLQLSGDLDGGLQLTVPNFAAVSRGSDFDPRQRMLNCQAHLNIGDGEKGWQASPDLIRYRGFSVLDSADASVNFIVTSYWSQDPANTCSSKTTVSNTDGTRLAKFVDTDVRHEVWSPCVSEDGGSVGILNLNFRAQAVSSNATALAYFGPLEVLGRPDLEVSQTITYKWRRC